MKKLFLAITHFCCFISLAQSQNQWDIQLNQSFLNCDGNQVCYQVELQNANTDDWALGDQNYRFFFDGDLMTVVSVTSLLPSTYYNPVSIDQNIKISGQGQEAASPLDDIDDNLGFLDFSIIQSNKSDPSGTTQISNTIVPVAEICVEVTTALADDCLSLYHSRPSTAGAITNQYTTISENDTSGSTVASNGNQYDDLNQEDGDAACFNAACSGSQWNIQLNQSFLNCDGNQVCYQVELQNANTDDWALGDQNYRFFFDGDLMTVVSVTSLLPSTYYNPVSIDQNIKISGQGQEAASPLDDIDGNLGFLDFSIIQSNKSDPSGTTQISNTIVPVAEICVEVTTALADDCLSLYHSRPSTAGTITNQYTTISENDTPGSTAASNGNEYDDLNQEDGDAACFGTACSGSKWGMQFNRSVLDCNNNQVCYHLQVKSNSAYDWALGDQNYRFFFDGDLMTITSITSLIVNPAYSGVTINQNIKVSGQGQEAASPLDDIDDNLGFLDFSIIQTDKSNPTNAFQLNANSYISVAEICIDVVDAAVNDATACLGLYSSRASTAGTFTNQYTTLTENNEAGSTITTTGNNINDLNSSNGNNACISQDCITGDCTFYTKMLNSNCCKPCPSGNLQVRSIYWLENYVDLASTNIALHKPSQFNGIPRLDNNNASQVTNGKYEGEIVGVRDYSYSNVGINNRWDVDLIGNYDLESINIYTKTGCCPNGANSYHIFISATEFTSDNLQTLLNDASIQQYSLPIQTGSTPLTISNLNTTGRFVRIFLEGESQMQLVEVEVIGSGNSNSSPYQYSWNDSNIGNNPEPTCLEAGTYEVTITDAGTGCTATIAGSVEN